MITEKIFYLGYFVYNDGKMSSIEFGEIEEDEQKANMWLDDMSEVLMNFGYIFKRGIHKIKINVGTY